MTNFLKKVALFLGFWVGITLLLAGIHRYLLARAYDAGNFKLDSTIEMVVLGDSHTQTALNPEILENAVNTSATSEHYFYSYQKLKLLLGSNPGIKTVLLGCAYHNFSESYDHYLFPATDDKDAEVMYNRYWMILDREAQSYLSSFTGVYLRNFFRYQWGMPFQVDPAFLMKSALSELVKSDYAFLGNYYASRRSNLSQERLQKALTQHYFNDGGELNRFSERQELFLRKIIRLCESRGIQLFLINTPLHPRYREGVPEEFRNYYQTLISDLTAGSAVKHIDLTTIALPDSLYGDGDHVNYLGAAPVSEMVNELHRPQLSKPSGTVGKATISSSNSSQ